jgi:hypothetical protein
MSWYARTVGHMADMAFVKFTGGWPTGCCHVMDWVGANDVPVGHCWCGGGGIHPDLREEWSCGGQPLSPPSCSALWYSSCALHQASGTFRLSVCRQHGHRGCGNNSNFQNA